jgi:hypothetical protein
MHFPAGYEYKWRFIWGFFRTLHFRDVLPTRKFKSKFTVFRSILTKAFNTSVSSNTTIFILGCSGWKHSCFTVHGMDRIWSTNGLCWWHLNIPHVTNLNRGMRFQHNVTRTHRVSIPMLSVCMGSYVQFIPFETQLNNSNVLRYKNSPLPCTRLSQPPPWHSSEGYPSC